MGDKTLEEKTQSYWEVAKAYNSSDKSMTCEQAIKKLGEVEDTTNYQKKIARKASNLLDDIIGMPPAENEGESTFPFDDFDFAA